MRKSDATCRAATRASTAVSLADRRDKPTELVCLALVLALAALALRIVTIW